MKAIIVFSAIVACVVASYSGGSYGGGYESGNSYAAPMVSKVVNVNTGHSTQYRKQSGWGPYSFGYDASWSDGAWGSGAHSRHETGDAWGNKEGSYSLNIGDGRSRMVKYTADGAGFRASIKTNEPGIVASNPAAVNINTPTHGYSQASYGSPSSTITHVGGYSTHQSGYGGSSGGYGGEAQVMNSGYGEY